MRQLAERVALEVVAELRPLGMTMLGLTAALFVQHFFVYCQIIQPSFETKSVEPWMWGALATPELIACFLSGSRLRSWAAVVMYAGMGTLVRDVFYVMLTVAGEPGHEVPLSFGRNLLSTSAVGLLYLIAFGLASSSWRGDARPVETASLTGVPRA